MGGCLIDQVPGNFRNMQGRSQRILGMVTIVTCNIGILVVGNERYSTVAKSYSGGVADLVKLSCPRLFTSRNTGLHKIQIRTGVNRTRVNKAHISKDRT